MRLEDLSSGVRVAGVVPGETVSVVAAQWHGSDAVELTYKTLDGGLRQQVLFRADEAKLSLSDAGSRPFDADAEEFRLVAEAQRISLAGLFDPMLAVATSDVQPLPHQIRAVYGEMLDRTPLRFLLADDPGAGKTIMAGLYIKELLLREDVKRCLIVAPGGLVDQWQDELYLQVRPALRHPHRRHGRRRVRARASSSSTRCSSHGWTSSRATRICSPSSTTPSATWSSSTRPTAWARTTSAAS